MFVERGTPEFIRSGNGAEFTAKAGRERLVINDNYFCRANDN
jgi:hypothetical protein